MEIKYQFPSLSRKYDTEEYIYDANVTDYIEEVSRRHPGKEIELAREAWKEYKDKDQNISDLAEENEIKSEQEPLYDCQIKYMAKLSSLFGEKINFKDSVINTSFYNINHD